MAISMLGGVLAPLMAAGVAVVALLPSITAQNAAALPAGCVSLQGSKQCPSFEKAYINPSNLTRAWPWMSAVSDVNTFDEQFALYWTDPNRFHLSKISSGLQCNRTGAANYTLQYERTLYCGQFTQISYSAACNANVEPPITVCQSTCETYADSEATLVANTQACAPNSSLSAARRATRNRTLTNDRATCTTWQALVSNSSSCVQGEDNEGNCGFGPNANEQLCAACDPDANASLASCCTSTRTDLSQCASFGHPAAARVSATSTTSTSSSSAPTSSSTSNPADAATAATEMRDTQDRVDLNDGQLAGILVGSIIGALLLGALIAFFLCGRKRRNKDNDRLRGAVYGSAAASRASGDKPWNSEDHMSRRSMAGSPEMEKPNVGGSSHAINMMALGAGGAAAAGAAGRSDDRASSPLNRPHSAALTTSSAGEKGATVQTVRDQYTGQDIHVGEDVVAIYPYNASLNDEMSLEPEQRVTILRLYDDGWALGRGADGREGALPLVCVSSTKGDLPGRRGGNGTSTGTSDDEGLTSGNEYTSSVDGAVTAEEGGFTSDARSQRSRR
jgi:hypothetical protein